MTTLLSGKMIVGFSIFLLITLLYMSGQLGFDASSFAIPVIGNPFVVSMNPVLKSVTPMTDALPYEQIVSKWSSRYVEKLQPQRQAIEAANCDLLEEQYRVNTGWELRPYVKYRMIQLGC